MAHAFDHHNASLSEGRALAAVVGALPGKPYGTRVGTDSPRRLRHPWQGGAQRTPGSHGAPRLEGEEVEGATPYFLALVRHRAGEMVHAKVHHFPPRFWGRSLHSDPWREGHPALLRPAVLNSGRPGSRPSHPLVGAGARTGPSAGSPAATEALP